MARNEEKHFSKLNRLLLQQQKEDQEKKNPPRPRLNALNSAEEIKKWLPGIKRDIDFYLKQSQVPCYPERKIAEFEGEINRLSKEYKAFVSKLRDLDPACKVVPWTERAYSAKKRPHSPETKAHAEGNPSDSPKQEGHSKEAACQDQDEVEKKDTLASSNLKVSGTQGQDKSTKFERLVLPVLDTEAHEHTKVKPTVVWNVDQEVQDKPLDFNFSVAHKEASHVHGVLRSYLSPHVRRKGNMYSVENSLRPLQSTTDLGDISGENEKKDYKSLTFKVNKGDDVTSRGWQSSSLPGLVDYASSSSDES